MRLTRSKKWLATAAGVVTVGVAATAAFAYFTTTGSGDGSATVGTSSELTLHGTTDVALYPGTDATVSFTVDNDSPGHQWVGTITLDSVSTDAAHAGCVMTDFTMDDVDASQDVPNGDGTVIGETGILEMANTAVSQDACKDAPLTLHLSSN
jgi:hypothetical protein